MGPRTLVDLLAWCLCKQLIAGLQAFGEYRGAVINSSICLAMFTFQITFKSEVCVPEPQFGGNKSPLAAASSIWKSFAGRDGAGHLGKSDVLRERDLQGDTGLRPSR